MSASPSATPFPAGTRVLHIGPHKTGTTTLQASFHASREGLAAQGVHYAGPTANPMLAAMAAGHDKALPTRAAVSTERWDDLVAEVAGRPRDERVVVSSEFFGDAADTRIGPIIEALGGDAVHVVVTLRPLARILPSQWQQYVQNRLRAAYEPWLRSVLDPAAEKVLTPTFWRRHRHDELIARWADVVGPDRLTVVVVDERDKTMLTTTFERLLDLTPGTLLSPGTANRSLTHVEVELLRSLNQLWRTEGWSDADYTRMVRFGAARHLQERRPAPGEERILTPPWAVDRAHEVQREIVARLLATGVRVIGDPATLSDPELSPETGQNTPVTDVPADVVARLAVGLARTVSSAVHREETDASRTLGPIEAAARARGTGPVASRSGAPGPPESADGQPRRAERLRGALGGLGRRLDRRLDRRLGRRLDRD